MKVIRDINVDGNFNSSLFNILSNLPEEVLYYKEHNLRHPLAIFNISSGRIFKALESILSDLKTPNIKPKDINTSHIELLNSIIAFKDDSFHLFKSLYPRNKVDKEVTFADKWLEKVDKKIIKDFKSDINESINKTRLIVNVVKHNHGRYGNIRVVYSSFIGSVLGYYIQGVDCEGAIEPHTDIHPKHKNMFTAISYNKDIREQLALYYFISECISKTIIRIINKQHLLLIRPKKTVYQHNDKLIEIINKVIQIKEAFFPDEYNTEIPQISLDNNKLIIRKPSYKSYLDKLILPPSTYKVNNEFSADGVSTKWKMPYL